MNRSLDFARDDGGRQGPAEERPGIAHEGEPRLRPGSRDPRAARRRGAGRSCRAGRSVVLADVPCARKLCATTMSPGCRRGTTIRAVGSSARWVASLTSPQWTGASVGWRLNARGEPLVRAGQDVEAAGGVGGDRRQRDAEQDVEHRERRPRAAVDVEVAGRCPFALKPGKVEANWMRSSGRTVSRISQASGSSTPAAIARKSGCGAMRWISRHSSFFVPLPAAVGVVVVQRAAVAWAACRTSSPIAPETIV